MCHPTISWTHGHLLQCSCNDTYCPCMICQEVWRLNSLLNSEQRHCHHLNVDLPSALLQGCQGQASMASNTSAQRHLLQPGILNLLFHGTGSFGAGAAVHGGMTCSAGPWLPLEKYSLPLCCWNGSKAILHAIHDWTWHRGGSIGWQF